jgi:tetratricopeptide (TPR) repeat protein
LKEFPDRPVARTFMNFLRESLLIIILLGLCPSLVSANSLDVFETGKTFPTDFLFKEGIPNLKNLGPLDMDPVLQTFIDARQQVESPAQNNLIHLGIAYLYLAKHEYDQALAVLNHDFTREFILEDFRTYFLSVASRQLAEERMDEKHWDQAVVHLKKAYQYEMMLFEKFPSSPFHEEIPRRLAHIEIRLGDAYFKREDYSSAWSYYNQALVREYPGHEKNRLNIYLALARTYEAGKNLDEAADIYIFLLNNFPSKATRPAARAFLKNNLETLESMNGNAGQMKRLLQGGGDDVELPVKPVARKLPKWPQTSNRVIDNLYLALSMNDFPKIMDYGTKVLKEFPGDENAKGVLNHVNQALLNQVRKESWSRDIEALVDLYPVAYLSRLARKLWENGFPDDSLRVYQKLLDKFPAETLACHKALFFMGRIEEDNHRYERAIDYYEKLMDRYNWGYFTPAARFKIPWIHRLRGNLDAAQVGFNQLLKYANPDKYRNLDNGFPEPDDFRPAALYWLAEIEGQSENYEKRSRFLNRLINQHPLDFYAVVARMEMFRQPLEFLEPGLIQKAIPRKWGLGEINRKRINRAEKLISIGFLEMGMNELSEVTQGEDHQEFLYYLAQLFKKAGGFQKAIGLSWGISRKNNHSISPSLAEILFPKPYLQKAIQESARYRLSPYLVLALMRQESAFNKKVVSSAQAIGLMQLLPSTASKVARSMGEKSPDQKDLKKPEVNIQLGVKYLHEMLNDFEDNIIFALASYNAGPAKVRQWIEVRSVLKPLEFMESIPFKETRNYVKKVLRNYVIYKTLYGPGGIHDFQGILTVRKE